MRASAETSSQPRPRGERRGRLHPGRLRPRAGHAPGLADRRLAAGHAHREQRPHALEPAQVAAQQLAAPHRPVGAVPGPVVDRPQRRPGLAVLGQARGQVRVVVLHAHEIDIRALERELRRQVLGVQVVGDDLGLHREQPLEVRDARDEGAQRLVVLQVADVVAHPRPRALGHAERALQLRPAREHVPRRRHRQPEAVGHVARASAAAPAAARRRRARPSRRCGSGSAGRGRGSRRRSPPGAPGRRRPCRRSARPTRCRWSAPAAPPRRPAAGGAAASRAASRRARAPPAPPPRPRPRPAAAAPARSAARAETSRSSSTGSSATSARAATSVGAISANGLSSRCLRARSAATAASSSARQARW